MTRAGPQRSLEAAARALLGTPCRVLPGRRLSSDGASTVWLPWRAAPVLVDVVGVLQAMTLAREHRGLTGVTWRTIITNLLVARDVVIRYPGVLPVYAALDGHAVEHAWQRSRSPEGLGDEVLALILSGGPPSIPSSLVSETAAGRWTWWWDAWRRWEPRRLGPPPVPDAPVPSTIPLYLATAAVGEPTEVGSPATGLSGAAGPPQSGLRVPMVTPEGTRLIVSLPGPPPSPSVSVAAVSADGPHRLAAEASSPPAWETGPIRWYDEWDCASGRYRPHWCALREQRAVGALPADGATLATSADARRVRRAFERLRPAARWRRAESEGPELDLDACVRSRSEGGRRGFADDRLFRARLRAGEPSAVGVLVDVSESTMGWTLDVERRALSLVGTALDTVGDVFGLYAFRGHSRLGCEVLTVKAPNEHWGPPVLDRVASPQPRGYTRIGAALRHVTTLLQATGLRHRMLLLVTDGMPFDVDGYGGSYAIEDTRRAWLEARGRGIRPYCLTVDVTARDYLPRMCGPAAWTVVSRPELLPQALIRLYGRLRR